MTILETIFGRPGPVVFKAKLSGNPPITLSPTREDFAAMTPEQIFDKLIETVGQLAELPPPAPDIHLRLLAPIKRTPAGAWRVRGRRFRSWGLAFSWAARHRLVVAWQHQPVNPPDLPGLLTFAAPPCAGHSL